MTRVLLVTGARSLADDPAAEAWARGLIAAALRGVDLLIVGDADGPDGWAWTIAGNLVVECHEYLTHGLHAGMIAEYPGIGAPRIEQRWSMADTHPLRRNIAMVKGARWRMLLGADVRCLALLDGRKPAVVPPGEKRPTRGTEHTARLARDAGLTVDAQTWGSRG